MTIFQFLTLCIYITNLEVDMKKYIVGLFVLLTLFSFISCKAELETATLRVEMDSERRTLKPDEKEMSIYGYKVIAVSPDGKESDPYYTYYSYINIDGLNGKSRFMVSTLIEETSLTEKERFL